MVKNVGGKNRMVRISGGVILIIISYLRLAGHGYDRVIIGAVGIYGLATGLIRYCLINAVLKINTCKVGS